MAEPFSWQKAFLHAVRTRDVIILHGNIRDRYICQDGQSVSEDPFDETVVRLLARAGFAAAFRFDPYLKAVELRLSGAGTVVEVLLEQGFGSPGFVDTQIRPSPGFSAS